jgi:hypothetical protein
MKTQAISNRNETAKFILPLFIAFVITSFLFYIDEGFYDFRWMLNIGSWIVLLFYVAVIYVIQLILVLPFYSVATKWIISAEKIILAVSILLFVLFIIGH